MVCQTEAVKASGVPSDPHHERRCLAIAIRELRARRTLRQEEVQDAAGLSKNYLSAVENGKLSPSFDSLVKIARGLGVPLSTLVDLYEERLTD